jgi:hypothetical protein
LDEDRKKLSETSNKIDEKINKKKISLEERKTYLISK